MSLNIVAPIRYLLCGNVNLSSPLNEEVRDCPTPSDPLTKTTTFDMTDPGRQEVVGLA